jgi:hypothetical protein
MNGSQSIRQRDGIAARLDLEPFEQLCGELVGWRIDPVIRMMEKERAEGRVLAFVRGLRLSARLIYATRDVLSRTDLEADWGHMVDDDGVKCSPECDVIIHHRGYRRRWNGTSEPVMDFKFVDCTDAVAVISCKSYLKSVGKDYEDYARKVRKYVKGIWLFAECCPPNAVDRLRDKAREAGYGKFWYLYTWDGESPIVANRKAWLDFLESVDALRSNPSSRGSRR